MGSFEIPEIPKLTTGEWGYTEGLSITNNLLKLVIYRRVIQIIDAACHNKRVSHLICNGKKYRTRKKNSKRALKIIAGGKTFYRRRRA